MSNDADASGSMPQMQAKKDVDHADKYVRMSAWCTLFSALVTFGAVAISVYIAWQAVQSLRVSASMNTMTCTGQLFSEEEQWKVKCAGDPNGFTIFAVVPTNVPFNEYAATLLSLIQGAPPTNIQSAKHLFDYTWGARDFHAQGKNNFRKVYDIAESVLYHLNTCVDYSEAGVIPREELQTWLPLLNDVGPHPMLLCAIMQGHDMKYITRSFARVLQERMRADSRRKAVEAFYPDMLRDEWLDGLIDTQNSGASVP